MTIKRIISIFIIIALGYSVYAQTPQKNTIKSYQFVIKPFNNKITSGYLTDNYWWRQRLKKEIVRNQHNNQIDTIIYVKTGQSEFRFYKTRDREMFFYADIRNRRIKLNHNIHIGMRKGELEQLFEDVETIEKNPFSITNRNQISKCNFHFRRNRVKRIVIDYYID